MEKRQFFQCFFVGPRRNWLLNRFLLFSLSFLNFYARSKTLSSPSTEQILSSFWIRPWQILYSSCSYSLSDLHSYNILLYFYSLSKCYYFAAIALSRFTKMNYRLSMSQIEARINSNWRARSSSFLIIV